MFLRPYCFVLLARGEAILGALPKMMVGEAGRRLPFFNTCRDQLLDLSGATCGS
jgi:hypothetical protein